MVNYVKMPKLGLTMTEGTIIRWLKKEGDPIAEGDELVEIETDKTTNIEESKYSGVLLKIYFPEDEVVPTLTRIAAIGDPGETVDENPAGESAKTQTMPEKRDAEEKEKVPALSVSSGQRVIASPLAKKLARELGVDLGQVAERVKGKRIEKNDVKAFAEQTHAVQTEKETPGKLLETAAAAVENGAVREPLNGMRKAIARTLSISKQTIPHFYLRVSVDMTNAIESRNRFNAKAVGRGGAKLAFDFIIAKAAALALKECPLCNRIYDGDAFISYGGANVALAVSVADGIFVPVVKDVEKKSMEQLAAEYRLLIGKARNGTLRTSECTDGVLTISNLGMYDVDSFQAIVNPPQSGILAIGKTRDQAVIRDGGIHIRPMMTMTASFDHRAVDGAAGAEFMQRVKQILENPAEYIHELK